MPLAALQARVAPNCRALESRLHRLGLVELCRPRNEHIPEIISLLKSYQLMESERVEFDDAGPEHSPGPLHLENRWFNPIGLRPTSRLNRNYSNAVLINHKVAGVLLAQLWNPQLVFIQYRAVAPAFIRHEGMIDPFTMVSPLTNDYRLFSML
jgi:hypothetical protein